MSSEPSATELVQPGASGRSGRVPRPCRQADVVSPDSQAVAAAASTPPSDPQATTVKPGITTVHPSGAIAAWFDGKPASYAIFRIVAERIATLGPVEITVASQISFGRTRKFAWFWLYNVTKKDPEGVPHLMLALDHKVDVDRGLIRDVSQVGTGRWNHQIVLRTRDGARSRWLADLIRKAYEYGAG
jgi:hypothetical protein